MSCSKPVALKITDRFGVKHYASDITGRPIKVPCGYCIGCKTDKINTWTNRITYEYANRVSSFVALTYDDYHLNYNRGYYSPTLKREDLHKFVDNLRHYVSKHADNSPGATTHFKVFAVGEYGGEKGRPHYHVLIMGLSPQYCAGIIPKLWKKGHCRVDPMFRGSVSYVLKYMSKQQNKQYNKLHFTAFGLDKPFISASPGIGSVWYLSHAEEILKTGYISDGGKCVPVPTYWKNKIFSLHGSLQSAKDMIEFKSRLNMQHDLEARDKGYWSYDTYVLEKARITEMETVNELRRQGIPVEDYKNYGHVAYRVPKNYSLVKKYADNKKLAFKALTGYEPKDY